MKYGKLSVVLIFCGIFSGVAQTNVLFYGAESNELSVAFVDTKLSLSDKLAIIADLQICLKEWGTNMSLRLTTEADKPDLIGYLDRASTCPHYPEGIDFPKEIITVGERLALKISPQLSDVYTNALAFARANAPVLMAANSFVDFVVSTNFDNITSNQLTNYIYMNQAAPKDYYAVYPRIINDIRQQTYYKPSILSFYYSANGPSEQNLWMLIPCTSLVYGTRTGARSPPFGMTINGSCVYGRRSSQLKIGA